MLLQMPFLELLYLYRLVKCSCRCFFLLICKNMHPQLAFSLLADTLLQKYASATCLFSILQILPCKNLHPQLAFSLSCRYSTLQYTLLSYNHQFNWWFIISPPKGYPTARPKGRISQALLLVRYKAVPLESSFLDSSACSLIYFWTASSVIFPIVST